MKPDGVVEVVPRNVAEFNAAQWDGTADDPAMQWMADRFGWTLKYLSDRLVIIGRHRKRTEVHPSYWVVALGVNGSVRVVTERVFARDYREVESNE